MTKQERRQLGDIRHFSRDQKIAQLRKCKQAVAVEGARAECRGMVVEIGPGICRVDTGRELLTCAAIPGLAIGDHAGIRGNRVTCMFPRRTVLSRPAPSNDRRELVIAANIDLVVAVTSVGAPPLRIGLIDRCLIAATRGGANALVCVNKIDLLQSPEELQPLREYPLLGVPVVRCSTFTGEGICELENLLAGNVCVLAGHSGTGKSSLLNTLCPGAGLRTGEVEKKGRHTTVSSSVHRLANGATVIDTPGIRQFGLWNLAPGELKLYFPEFEEYARNCRFRDCTHTHEPECAVKEAGIRRYPMYLRILASM